jgi:tetratricopeptide (TPR) repeat protein
VTSEPRRGPSRIVVGGLLVLGIVGLPVLLIVVFSKGGGREAAPLPDPVQFVARAVCVSCHEEDRKEWTGSHHDLAMDVATEETVLGDFNDATFSRHGITSRFFKRNRKFYVHTDGPGGKMADFEVLYVFGVVPLQQYLVALDRGYMQALTIAWDTEQKRWFHLYPDERTPHDDELHWTAPNLNWNYMCAECHSTNLQRNYDPEADRYETTWTEIDVSCQACHGPGSHHVAWAERVERTGESYEPQDAMGLVIRFKGTDARTEIEACARCHSRRNIVTLDYVHGRPFLDDYELILLRPDRYFADGQILDEVYVYGSFVQSRMYHEGVRCTDCHNAHSARVWQEGDSVCIRCHQLSPPPEFETLEPKKYDTKEHHFHEPGKEGSFCVDCHMPSRNYMVVDPRRDHSFRIPRPDLRLKLGIPDACTRCHEDKPVEWSVEAFEKWYPTRGPRPVHFAEAIVAGRAGKPEALPGLVSIASDRTQAGIVRATALRLIGRYGVPSVVEDSLRDEDALVRAAAVRAVEVERDPRRKLALLAPRLTDEIRLVRAEAARVLTTVPMEQLDQRQRDAFDAALEEFKVRQRATAERASAYLNLGVMHANLGRIDRAEASYLRAISKDPRFLPARFNLANLYNASGRNSDAEGELQAILKIAPDQGEAHYSLGLLLAEGQRIEEAALHLGRAAELLPARARVRCNQALALQHLGRRDEAEAALVEADRMEPRDPDIVNALAVFYAQQGAWRKALPYARRLVELAPESPGPKRMVRQIERELSR